MSTDDIKKMNDTITTINTAMSSSRNGIKIARYENAIGRLATKSKQHSTAIKSLDKHIGEVDTDLDKLQSQYESDIKKLQSDADALAKEVQSLKDLMSNPRSIDESKFLSAEYATTIEDILKSVEDIWNVIEYQDDTEGVDAIDELLIEEQDQSRSSRRKK